MAIMGSHLYQSSFALLVWLQKIEKYVATKYDIDLPEMNYLASSLSSKECYDFYNLLSHRRAIRGQISIYAEKERAQEISCISLLATWLKDPSESTFRSNENIELKLREIGRGDLARWVLGKIISSLERRHLDVHEINGQIEESETNDVIVRNRIGERIIPVASVDDVAFMKNENISDDKQQAFYILWKVLFGCAIILLLAVLFLCFYRLVYTKWRCTYRRFDNAEDREHCLPEQTYGTTSCSDYPMNNSRKKKCDNPNFKDNNDPRTDIKNTENFELSEKCFSNVRTNDEIFSCIIRKKENLLLNRGKKLTKISATRDNELSSNLERNESLKFSSESQVSLTEMKKSFSSLAPSNQGPNDSPIIRKNNFIARHKFSTRRKSPNNPLLARRCKSTSSRRIIEATKKIYRSKSENFLSLSRRANDKMILERQNISSYRETRNIKNFAIQKWTSCECNLMMELPRNISRIVSSDDEKIHASRENMKNLEKINFPSLESLSVLSETYDELGMLFSEEFKRQSRPCRRKYCRLTRKLRRGRCFFHDSCKCRNRRKIIFGEKIIISWDRRPACGSGNICKDTYDEYEIMRAKTREERERLARSIIRRRKYFLDQPCLSPPPSRRPKDLTKFDEN